jgi:transcriptional regulator with XRE-family HTH domain
MKELKAFLNMEYLKWQQKEGGRRTIQDFADYLDVDRPTLSVWMNGKRVPDDRNVDKLAYRLGQDIYDVLGRDKPDPRLVYITHNWSEISEEGKEKISKEAAKYDPKKANQGN